MCSKGLPLPWDPLWGNPFSVERDGVSAERALRGWRFLERGTS